MTGRPREWDYAEVAQTWHLAVDRGENPIEAVAALKGRTADAAKYAITQARSLGLIPPAVQRERPASPPLEDVARLWHDATVRGVSPTREIAVEFAVLDTYATALIARARKAGLIPPGRPTARRRRKPGSTVPAPHPVVDGACPTCGTVLVPTFALLERLTVDPEKPAVPAADRSPGGDPAGRGPARRVLMCDDCEFTCEIARPRLLFRHCFEVHGRRPTLDERRPARTTAAPSVSHLTAAHLR